MGCFTKRSLNGWNFITAQLANNVTVSDLANTINYCSLTLDAPSSLMATAISISDINLSWVSNSDGSEGGFGIERSSDGFVFVQIDTVGVGITTYLDSGLSDGIKYYYQVRAIGVIPSAYSNIVDARTFLDFGLALNTSKADNRLEVPISGLTFPTIFNFTCWFKFDDPSAVDPFNILFATSDGAAGSFQNGYYINCEQLGANEVEFSLRRRIGGIDYEFTPQGVDPYIADTGWHFLAIRTLVSGTDQRYNFSVDGVDVGSSNLDNLASLTSFYAKNTVGNFNNLDDLSFELPFSGSIDQAVLYDDGEIDNAKLLELYNNGMGVKVDEYFIPTPLFVFDFDKAGAMAGGDNTLVPDVTISEDSSGNGYDGTLTNFTLNGTTSNYVDSVN